MDTLSHDQRGLVRRSCSVQRTCCGCGVQKKAQSVVLIGMLTDAFVSDRLRFVIDFVEREVIINADQDFRKRKTE